MIHYVTCENLVSKNIVSLFTCEIKWVHTWKHSEGTAATKPSEFTRDPVMGSHVKTERAWTAVFTTIKHSDFTCENIVRQ
jgi:hypothetical protein